MTTQSVSGLTLSWTAVCHPLTYRATPALPFQWPCSQFASPFRICPLAPPVYTVNELWMTAPKEITDDVVPDSASTALVAPCPALRTSTSPDPDNVAVLPFPLQSRHVLLAMSNAPEQYHAFRPPG